jgi:ribonuclease-3
LEAALGHRFGDRSLLQQALTHRSASRPNNERLEFLGDAVLGYVIAERLFETRTADAEDVLTLMRASLVRRETLAEIARELDLGAFIRLGSGERRSGGHKRSSILADGLEAVLGAVHLDAGIEAARRVIVRLFDERMAALNPDAVKDPKTRLQEWLQGKNLPLPVYKIVETSGTAHEREFLVSCEVADLGLEVTARGRSRRAAEKNAANGMLERIAEL